MDNTFGEAAVTIPPALLAAPPFVGYDVIHGHKFAKNVNEAGTPHQNGGVVVPAKLDNSLSLKRKRNGEPVATEIGFNARPKSQSKADSALQAETFAPAQGSVASNLIGMPSPVPSSNLNVADLASFNGANDPTTAAQGIVKEPPKKQVSKTNKGKGKAVATRKKSDKPKPRAKAKQTAAKSHSATPDPESHVYVSKHAESHAYDPDAPSDDDEEDDREYCICKQRYDPDRAMICCDRCEGWYHTDCLRINDDELDLVNDFVCPQCTSTTGRYTTWKPQCIRKGCRKARVPLSKYCSAYCGIESAVDRLEACNINPKRARKAVADASKRKGFVIEEIQSDSAETFRIPVFSSVTPPAKTRLRGYNALKTSADATAAFKTLYTSEPNPVGERHKSALMVQSLQDALDHVRQQCRHLSEVTERCKRRDAFVDEAIRSWEASLEEHERKTLQNSPILPNGKKHSAKRGKGPSGDAPCGFDMRLVLDDDEFYEWLDRRSQPSHDAAQSDELGNVCTITRKRCDRHQDWQKLHKAAVELDLAVTATKLERLVMQETNLQERIAKARSEEAFRFRLLTESDAIDSTQNADVDIFT